MFLSAFLNLILYVFRIAKAFVRSMENIKKTGAEFVTKEKARLKTLLDNKATAQTKKDGN